MKKVYLLIVLLGLSGGLASAHPGNTDANGCHTCRTNCTKWGLSYGEYHCHNSKTTSTLPETPTYTPSITSIPGITTTKKTTPTYIPTSIIKSAPTYTPSSSNIDCKKEYETLYDLQAASITNRYVAIRERLKSEGSAAISRAQTIYSLNGASRSSSAAAAITNLKNSISSDIDSNARQQDYELQLLRSDIDIAILECIHTNAPIIFDNGYKSYNLGDYKNAVKYYEQYIQASGDGSKSNLEAAKNNIGLAYRNLGDIEFDKKNRDTAIVNYKLCLNYKPKDLNANYALGSAYYNKGDYLTSLNAYKAASKLATDTKTTTEIQTMINLVTPKVGTIKLAPPIIAPIIDKSGIIYELVNGKCMGLINGYKLQVKNNLCIK